MGSRPTNQSPFRPGPRTIVARSCSKCHRFLQADDFYKDWYKTQSACKDCQNKFWKHKNSDPEKSRARVRKFRASHLEQERRRGKAKDRKAYELTIENATRSGYVWTGPEIELLDREDLTILEMAIILKRTYSAVSTARSARNRGTWANHRDKTMMSEEGGL